MHAGCDSKNYQMPTYAEQMITDDDDDDDDDDVDIDVCAIMHGGCNSNARCINTVDNFTCACLPGYTGDGFTCKGALT